MDQHKPFYTEMNAVHWAFMDGRRELKINIYTVEEQMSNWGEKRTLWKLSFKQIPNV